jgi:hypothetical protein
MGLDAERPATLRIILQFYKQLSAYIPRMLIIVTLDTERVISF